MTNVWDAIVVGAGPAGSYAALKLARAGARTLLVDRKSFPRPKPCGGCLNAQAVDLLTAAGLGDAVRAAGARPLAAVQLRAGRRRATVPLPGGLAVTRATLDALLVRAAIAAGCDFLVATVGIDDGDAGAAAEVRRVRLNRTDMEPVTASAKVVIAADGLGHSSLSDSVSVTTRVDPKSRVGVSTVGGRGCVDAPAGVVTMAVGPGGYVGIVGVEGGLVNVAAALDAPFLKSHGSPGRAVREILGSAGIAASADLDALDWQGTFPLTRQLARPAGHRLFVLGDAAGYVEPFTGEGMAWALSAAGALTSLVMRAIARWETNIETEWLDTYDATVRRRQRWCRLAARALRHPALVHAAVGSLSRWPGLAAPFVSRIAPAGIGVPIGQGR